ncbi:MAG: hypothetical protein GXO03_01525 [Aquificae bacterium]|nr:hypothetical protein [Aquificota bacterium]
MLFLLPALALAGVLATVNGEAVTKDEFEKLFNAYWERVKHLSKARPTKEDKRTFLLDYVRSLIVLKEAEKMGITVTEEELKEFINERIGRTDIKNGSLKKLLKAELVTQKLAEKLFNEKSYKPTEGELKAYYLVYQRAFYYPASVKLAFYRVKTRKEAERVREALLLGRRPEGAEGPRVMWYSIAALPRQLKSKLGLIRPGIVSEPVKVKDGFVVVKVLERRSGGVLPFEKALPLVKQRYLKYKRQEVFRKWFREVLERYEVKFYWERL